MRWYPPSVAKEQDDDDVGTSEPEPEEEEVDYETCDEVVMVDDQDEVKEIKAGDNPHRITSTSIPVVSVKGMPMLILAQQLIMLSKLFKWIYFT